MEGDRALNVVFLDNEENKSSCQCPTLDFLTGDRKILKSDIYRGWQAYGADKRFP